MGEVAEEGRLVRRHKSLYPSRLLSEKCSKGKLKELTSKASTFYASKGGDLKLKAHGSAEIIREPLEMQRWPWNQVEGGKLSFFRQMKCEELGWGKGMLEETRHTHVLGA